MILKEVNKELQQCNEKITEILFELNQNENLLIHFTFFILYKTLEEIFKNELEQKKTRLTFGIFQYYPLECCNTQLNLLFHIIEKVMFVDLYMYDINFIRDNHLELFSEIDKSYKRIKEFLSSYKKIYK